MILPRWSVFKPLSNWQVSPLSPFSWETKWDQFASSTPISLTFKRY